METWKMVSHVHVLHHELTQPPMPKVQMHNPADGLDVLVCSVTCLPSSYSLS